jgi:F0F1-type ATP synthase membrane subunit a
VGLLAGALWGAVRWATQADAEVGVVFTWIARIWIFTLFYTLFMVRLAARAALPGVGLQLLILFASAFLLYRGSVRKTLPRTVQKCGPIALAVVAVIVLMTLFPPVMRPSWRTSAATGHWAASPSLPIVAFILRPGFDARNHVPEFTVNVLALTFEWMVALMVGALTCYLVTRRTSHN